MATTVLTAANTIPSKILMRLFMDTLPDGCCSSSCARRVLAAMQMLGRLVMGEGQARGGAVMAGDGAIDGRTFIGILL